MAYERLVPGTLEWELYMGNHKLRYDFAKEKLLLLQSKRVLDAATGVGYGANLLAEVTKEIVAVDRDEGALEIANKNFKKDNILYVKDDCETLHLINGSFDAIVSFETLEHLKKPGIFLKRCYELLNPGGLIIISTPNQLVSGHSEKKDWQFHEKEYQPDEFKEIILSAGFEDLRLFGQYYSASGMLRNQFRAELNRIHSNPFMRAGRWLQKILRGVKDKAVLPELISDFEIKEYDAKQQPFVLIAMAKK